MFEDLERYYRDECDDEIFDDDGNIDKDIFEIISTANADHGLDQQDFDDSDDNEDYENL